MLLWACLEVVLGGRGLESCVIGLMILLGVGFGIVMGKQGFAHRATELMLCSSCGNHCVLGIRAE